MVKSTEKTSKYRNLDKMSTKKLLTTINIEDKTVPNTVEKCIPEIETLVNTIVAKMKSGGRLFYIGAGTSGRLGILDASECPPTYGVSHNLVIGLIAGGDSAIRKAVEFAEDDTSMAWKDLQEYNVNAKDVLVGIAASGTTPYVLGGLKDAKEAGITTACIVCNKNSPIESVSDYPIVCVVGAEIVTGSTRMKSGTAQKLILNMISTTVMIKLGRVEDNKMVHMQLSNNKLVDRGLRMIVEATGLSLSEAEKMLEKYGNVKQAIQNIKKV